MGTSIARRVSVGAMVMFLAGQASVAWGATVAYWRFEEGPADGSVLKGGTADGEYYPGTADSSGNGYALSAWSEGGYAGYAYRTDVPAGTLPQTGAANGFSVQNTGDYPGMFTQTGAAIQTITPAAFTIEASFKPETGGYRTIVGRDSQGANATDANLAALYFQIIPGDAVAIKFVDVSGYWHEAISAAGLIQGFDRATDPTGQTGHWYHMAAVSDGAKLSLYLNNVDASTGYQLVAQTDLTTSGSPNTALTAGMGDGADWDAGNWSVGRGLYGGAHVDRAYGFIDEVRISDAALDPSQFLFAPQYMAIWPSIVHAAPIDAPISATLMVPITCHASQAVDVTVTSDQPGVAKPAGSEGSTVVHYAAGSGSSQPVVIEFGSVGQAQFTLSATGGCPAGPGPALTVTVHAAEAVDLQIANELMVAGLSQQASVIASFGAAGTRDVSAASFGTSYTVTPAGIVEVSPDGLITAVGMGRATITAKYAGLTSPERAITVVPTSHTVAYWRFEEGPAGGKVLHGGQPNGVFYPGVADSSGNGNALSSWTEADWAGHVYRTDVPASPIPQTGETNNFSVKNTGGYPGMFTQTGAAIQTISPAAFTIEASFKPENGGYRTIVGRDSRGTATTNGDLAALYFQIQPDNSVAIKFCDVSGYWHEAISAAGAVQGFNWSEDPEGLTGHWYHMAAVSDGQKLSLYLNDVSAGTGYQLVKETDLTLSGSPNTALTAGAGDGADWDAGNWSVGRGLYAGGHGDRAYGYIDEVRISDAALHPSQFLFTPEYTVIWPEKINAAPVDPPTNVSLVIPASCNESQAVDVTITSNNPAVAKPAGSTGSAVIHFAVGASRLQTVAIEYGGAAGQAQFTLSTTGGCPIGPGAALTVTVYAAESVVLQTTYDIMQVGQSQQAKVIASFGAAGTRDVAAAAFGTSYAVVPTGVIDVSPDGLVTGASLGTAALTASHGGLTSQPQTIVVTTPGQPRLKVAGSGILLVDLSAADATAGQTTWINKGSLGDFVAIGQPVVGTVAGEKAVSFDGTAAYQGPAAPPELLGTQGRTIEVWAYNPAIECSQCIETMVAWGHRGGPCGSNLAFGFGDHPTWGAVAGWCDNGDIGWYDAGGSPPLGEWRYLVYTYDPNFNGGTTTLYDNGARINSEMSGAMPTHPGNINLLAQNLSANAMDVWMAGEVGSLSLAAVRIHDGALTPEEILYNYRAGIDGMGLIGPDLDLNGYVDMFDYALFAQCAAGPTIPLSANCKQVDFDGDGDGDGNDFGIFQRCYSGDIPAVMGCD